MKINRIPEANPETAFPFKIPVEVVSEDGSGAKEKGFVVGNYRNLTQKRLLQNNPSDILSSVLIDIEFEHADGRREPLEDGNGKPVEITKESLESLGLKFLTTIAEGIAADASPKTR